MSDNREIKIEGNMAAVPLVGSPITGRELVAGFGDWG